jgi:hypothetical protein
MRVDISEVEIIGLTMNQGNLSKNDQPKQPAFHGIKVENIC